MGVDPKWGRFPVCPEMSRFVPVCPLCPNLSPFRPPNFGFGKRGLLEKGSFQKSPFSRDSREFRDSRDFGEPPDCGK